MNFAQRALALLLFAIALVLPASQPMAQAYPTRSITFVVPFPAGGSADTIIRLIGQHLSQGWGQAVVVENKPGTGGNIGQEAVARAAPDGYTFLMAASSIAIVPHLYTKLSYDPINGFEPVTLVGNIPMVIVVNPQFQAKSLAELIALAKQKPGDISYASAGNGTTNHLATEMFKAMTGIDMLHIPYRGNPLAVLDVIGGRVPVFFDFVLTGLPHIRGGKVRALATTGATRAAVLPDVPTAVEAGVPGFVTGTWFGVYAPMGTPRAITDKLNAEILSILDVPAVKERLSGLGVEIWAKGPAELAAITKADFEKWGPVVKKAGIKLD